MRQGWPRIPLPATLGALEDSAAIGGKIAELLETGCAAVGVSSGTLPHELKPVGVLAKRNRDGEFSTHAQIDPAVDLKVTAGWSQLQQGGVVMPGRGVVAEHASDASAPWAGTVDVFLNEHVA